MEESKRQKQVAAVLLSELNEIFVKLGLNMMDGGMVSISAVKVTPDLLEARIYLSFFQVLDKKATFQKIEDKGFEIKKQLALKVKNQLRRIPVIQYYIDDTLDTVFKLEELFKEIKNNDSQKKDS